MLPNPILIQVGEAIHDALLHFAQVSDKPDWVWTNLEGGCAIAANFLTQEAQKRHIPAVLMAGNGHAWVESQGLIYDPTVIQYIYPNRCHLPPVMLPKVGVYPLDKVMAAEWGGAHPEWKLATHVKIPAHLDIPEWAYRRYTGRLSQGDNTKDNLNYVNHMWPQGTRPRGYHLEWQANKCRIYWRGKSITIG